jgi:hypothetical protein
MEYTETLTVTSCWCGIRLAIPDNLFRWLHDANGRACFCPLGHEFVFTENNEKKLARERAAHSATKDLLRREERSHSATRGQMTKLRKRVEAGVCPHCKRSFANLARHMHSKHAEEIAKS